MRHDRFIEPVMRRVRRFFEALGAARHIGRSVCLQRAGIHRFGHFVSPNTFS
jgi:hypothetical protein